MEGHSKIAGIIRCSPGISVISEIEMFGKKGITLHEENDVRSLLNGFEIFNLSDTIKEIAISLKQKYSIKTPDAIHCRNSKSI
jgi:cupin superfamily acireductone dioxygenase involved in methionine salvage